MFKKGDKLRCIDGIDFTAISGPLSKVVVGEIYTCSGISNPILFEVGLVETGDFSWWVARFELVAQQQKHTYIPVPTSILAPTGDIGSGGSDQLPLMPTQGAQGQQMTLPYHPFQPMGRSVWKNNPDAFWGVIPTSPQVIPNCECGVDSIGGGKHSTWCPKHNQGDNNG